MCTIGKQQLTRNACDSMAGRTFPRSISCAPAGSESMTDVTYRRRGLCGRLYRQFSSSIPFVGQSGLGAITGFLSALGATVDGHDKHRNQSAPFSNAEEAIPRGVRVVGRQGNCGKWQQHPRPWQRLDTWCCWTRLTALW